MELDTDQPVHLAIGLVVVTSWLITCPLMSWMIVLPRAMTTISFQSPTLMKFFEFRARRRTNESRFLPSPM